MRASCWSTSLTCTSTLTLIVWYSICAWLKRMCEQHYVPGWTEPTPRCAAIRMYVWHVWYVSVRRLRNGQLRTSVHGSSLWLKTCPPVQRLAIATLRPSCVATCCVASTRKLAQQTCAIFWQQEATYQFAPVAESTLSAHLAIHTMICTHESARHIITNTANPKFGTSSTRRVCMSSKPYFSTQWKKNYYNTQPTPYHFSTVWKNCIHILCKMLVFPPGGKKTTPNTIVFFHQMEKS